MIDEINKALRRHIKDGKEFDNLIPRSNCKAFNLGNGNNNTIEGVEFMAQWVIENSHQVKNLAKKLKKRSLSDTVASIFNFLYHHFQYNADEQMQNLRSPACAWSKRKEGIDCKSYTIFAISLCREMGLSSYIRQIRQPAHFEDEFTHVYAIVPINQEKSIKTDYFTGDYYVIDPTVKDNIEPLYIEAKDKFMNGLPYRGLKASCTPKRARKVVKGSNAGRRLQQGKSSGGRDLVKFRWGLLAPENSKVIKNINLLKPAILKSGYSENMFNGMLQMANAMITNGISEDEIRFFPLRQGFTMTDSTGRGQVFKHPNPQNGNWLLKFKSAVENNVGLNATQIQFTDSDGNTGGGGFSINDAFESIESSGWFDSLISDIGSWFGGVFGGGNFYKEIHVKENAERLHQQHLNALSTLNNALSNQNYNQFSSAVAELKLIAPLVEKTYLKKKSEGWSPKSESNLQASANIAKSYKEKLNQTLNAYLSQYFTSQQGVGSISLSSENWEENKGFFGMFLGTPQTVSTQVVNYQPKQNQSIPKFEINKQLVESILKNQPINTQSFLNTLKDIAVSVFNSDDQNGSNTNGNATEANNSGGSSFANTDNQSFTPNISTANLGLISAVAFGLIFQKQIKNFFTNSKK